MCDFRKAGCSIYCTSYAFYSREWAHQIKGVVMNKVLATCVLYWWIWRINYAGGEEDSVLSVTWAFLLQHISDTEQRCSSMRWEKHREDEQLMVESCGVNATWSVCMSDAGWQSARETPGRSARQLDGVQIVSYPNWAAGHRFSQTHGHRKGTNADQCNWMTLNCTSILLPPPPTTQVHSGPCWSSRWSQRAGKSEDKRDSWWKKGGKFIVSPHEEPIPTWKW